VRDDHEPGATVSKPEPLYVPWHGRMVRVRHDDPTLRPYWPNADRLRAAMTLASDVEGLRLVLATTIADRYEVQVPDDGSEIRLRRRT
jgi:hypothetical protein